MSSQPDNNHDWKQAQSGPHKGDWYYNDPNLLSNSQGVSGVWHVYEHGTRVFVPGGGDDGNILSSGGIAPPPAPAAPVAPAAPAPANPEPTPAPPVQSNGGVLAPAPGEVTLTPVSTAIAIPTVNPAPASNDGNVIDGIPAGETPVAASPSDGDTVVTILHNQEQPSTDTSSTPTATATPAPADASPAADPSNIYSVVSGDNMSNIAERHHMSLEQLEALNPQVQDPNLILPGQQLNLGNGEAVVPASVAASTPVDAPSAFPTTSSYDSTSTQTQEAYARKDGVGGWSDGTNSVPSDPAQGIAAVAPTNTDPLKINDDKPQES